MAMQPETKDRLMKFTAIAKAIIYNPDRMRGFLKLLGTKEGAVTAAKTVLAGIEQKVTVPSDVAPLLAVNSYMLMVDVAQAVMGQKPSPEILKEVIGAILQEIGAMYAKKQAPQPGAMIAQGA